MQMTDGVSKIGLRYRCLEWEGGSGNEPIVQPRSGDDAAVCDMSHG